MEASTAASTVTDEDSREDPGDRPDPDELLYIVVENGSITAEWDTGPWRGQSTSRFTGGGYGHHTY